MNMDMEAKEYHAPVLAKLFHQLPHINITFHFVNSTFAPKKRVYLEALGILASVPALWLILTLFLLLIYLCTRCCDRKPRPKNSISLLKWTLSIFTILCCGAIAVGLYGNDDAHNAVIQFITAIRAIDKIINKVKNQTSEIERTLEDKVSPLLVSLGDMFEEPVVNQTARFALLSSLQFVKGNTTSALASCQSISRPLQPIRLGIAADISEMPEMIRWPATMGILVVFLIFCVILLFGVARHSRCCLILFSVFGLFAVIVNCLLSSIYIAAAVGLGDLCVKPEEYIRNESPRSLQHEVVTHYLRCAPSDKNPFTQQLREAQRAVDAMSSNLNLVIKGSNGLYRNRDMETKLTTLLKPNIDYTEGLVSQMAALIDCRPIHRHYIQGVEAVCGVGLYGIAFMLLSSVSAALLFTVLVWVGSHTWIYIRKRRDYLQVAEQDPFLPPSAASQAIAARTLRHQGSYNGPPPTAQTPPSPRYTPSPSAPPTSFRERLRDPSIAGSVYYDPNIIYSDQKSLQLQQQPTAPADHYDYYSSILPTNANLTAERRGRNYNSRDSELCSAGWPQPAYKYSPVPTAETQWGPQ